MKDASQMQKEDSADECESRALSQSKSQVVPEGMSSEQARHWKLVWQDEFCSGTEPDRSKWSFVNVGGGFGNNELQHYTDRSDNACIEHECLVIQARRETYQGHEYTSAKLFTQHKGDWTYGWFDIRAKLPAGQGIWPAIWMMPSDYARYGQWPECGEIDIMEMVGNHPGTVHGTLHYGKPWKNTGGEFSLPDGASFADDFHVFSLEWGPGYMKWYVDGEHFLTQDEWYTSTRGAMWPAPFNREFYLQLNVAVGGDWPGWPDETTVFPVQMVVDYVRVFQSTEPYPRIAERSAEPGAVTERPAKPDGNLIYNDSGEEGGDYWSFKCSNDARAELTHSENEFCVVIENAGTNDYSVEFFQQDIPLRRHSTYLVSFTAQASQKRSMQVNMSKASQHWDNYSGNRRFDLSTEPRECRFEFEMLSRDDRSARLDFRLGGQSGDVCLSRIRVVKQNPIVDCTRVVSIEAEHYDHAEGIKTQPCMEGGENVGWIDAGDWLEYDLEVATDGDYELVLRYATDDDMGIGDVLIDGVSVQTVRFPHTGGWQFWQDAQAVISLQEGVCKLRIKCSSQRFNLNRLSLRCVEK